MKKIWLILGLALFSFMMTACEKSEPEDLIDEDSFEIGDPYAYFLQFFDGQLPEKLPNGWYYDVKDKKESYRSNILRFYFRDEQGNDLLDLEDETTWPVPAYTDEYLHNPLAYYDFKYSGELEFDTVEGCNCFYMFAPINGEHIREFPLVFKGNKYMMRLECIYTNKNVLGGSVSTYIYKWKLNGKVVFSDFWIGTTPLRNTYFKAYVTVKSDGQISVTTNLD